MMNKIINVQDNLMKDEMISLPTLSSDFIKKSTISKKDFVVENFENLPEKVLQFGTGVLLRGLPDYFIDKANRQGIFNGRIVVVKSTDAGDLNIFNQQDGLYTLCIRGEDDGINIEKNVVCSSISRVLSAKSQWQEILSCAASPEMQLILSNTTEVGIELVQDDILQKPPISFPGKLLAFLFERYKVFNGSVNHGMVIIPTELITDNGKKLESIVLELAHRNGLEPKFIDWIENANKFCNSLVDRIVPGMPEKEMHAKLQLELGYRDNLMTFSEVYRLWAIEGDEHVKSIASFYKAYEGIIVEPSIEYYRELKLRLLNGTHTLSCGLAFLIGLDTVKEAMDHPLFSVYIQNLMLGDIAAGIPAKMDEKAIIRFGGNTLDRFRNPYVKHNWINITVQYTSKMQMRNIPTLVHYFKNFKSTPQYISLGFAAYFLFMKSVREEDGKYFGMANSKEYIINDSKSGYYFEKWKVLSVDDLVNEVLKDSSLWSMDLTGLPGFDVNVIYWLKMLMNKGALETLQFFLQK